MTVFFVCVIALTLIDFYLKTSINKSWSKIGFVVKKIDGNMSSSISDVEENIAKLYLNADYATEIKLTKLSSGSYYLRQKFNLYGNLVKKHIYFGLIHGLISIQGNTFIIRFYIEPVVISVFIYTIAIAYSVSPILIPVAIILYSAFLYLIISRQIDIYSRITDEFKTIEPQNEKN